MNVYLAGPLFSQAERRFNAGLAAAVKQRTPELHIVLPQERAEGFMGRPDQNELIFNDCIDGVRGADAVVAILDGSDVDSGTAVELGYAFALGKPILGIRTDFRALEERGVNIMVAFACTEYVLDAEASIDALAERIAAFCRALRVRT
jgi:nucleoside 2-deoxyribosyltransferase